MKLEGKKLIIALASIVIIGVGGYAINEANKEYIDGNVLNLPYVTYNGLLDGTAFPLPWTYNVLVCHLMYRTLFLADHTLHSMTPDLAAKDVEILDNGMAYKITLKSGQKWSDGAEITMDDVVFSLENVQLANRANNLYKTTFAKIDSLEADGNVLTIRMKERTTMLRPMLAQLVILPKKHLENEDIVNLELSDFWQHPVSSGMYKIGETKFGEFIELVRDENFAGKKPKIEKVVMYTDTRKFDYYYTNNISEMINFRAMRGYTEYAIDMLFYRYFVFNLEDTKGIQNSAMQDKRIREAICMAIDRETFLREIYLNVGNITDGSGTIGAVGNYNYNPEKAKELIAESGYDLSRPLRIGYYYKDTTSINFLQQVKVALDAVGFNTELILQTSSDMLYKEKEYDFLLKGLGSFQVSEWYEEYSSKHAFLPNLLGSKGEFDSLIAEILGETDPAKYAELLGELSRLDQELLYKFPLFTIGQAVYINTDRVIVPNNLKLANYFYIADRDFANWEIKRR